MVCGFQELTGSLQDLLAQALEHIKGQETGLTALKLASLSLDGCPEVSVHEHETFLFSQKLLILQEDFLFSTEQDVPQQFKKKFKFFFFVEHQQLRLLQQHPRCMFSLIDALLLASEI